MAKTTADIFREFYPELLEILPIDCLISQLYSKQLLSSNHKERLQALTTKKERAKCFLDEVIEPGVKVGCMEQFDEMLAVMVKSDDPPVRFLAKEMKSRDIAPPTQTLYDLSLSPQARLQNAETQLQSKILLCVYILGQYISVVTQIGLFPFYIHVCMVSSFLGGGYSIGATPEGR